MWNNFWIILLHWTVWTFCAVCKCLSFCSSWSHLSSHRSPQRRTRATLMRSSRRRPSPSPPQRNVSPSPPSVCGAIMERFTFRTHLREQGIFVGSHGGLWSSWGSDSQWVLSTNLIWVCVSVDDEDGMDAADNERRPHFPQFSYSASGREWAFPPYQSVLFPFVAIWGKHVAILGKEYQSPLFFSFSASSQMWRSLFRDFKRGFCTVGQTSRSSHIKSPTVSTLFPAEGNVFCQLFSQC